MATISLYDWDLCTWKNPIVFNLELMKLAYYHKVHCHDVVQMTKVINTDLCTKTYIRKDYEDWLYPPELTENPKIDFNGLAIHNDQYTPMPLEIEQCPADTSIYASFSGYYSKNPEIKRVFRVLSNAIHLRLTLDGKTTFPNWENQYRSIAEKTRTIILHDKNLYLNSDLRRAIIDISLECGNKNVRFGSKFPIIITNPDELIAWGIYPKVPYINNLYLIDIIPDEVLLKIRKIPQNLTYLINNDNWTEEKFIASLPKIFMQAMFLSQHSTSILLKIDRNFYLDEQWHRFVDLFNAYIRSCKKYHEVLNYCCYVYCKHCHDELDREGKITLFKFIKENQPELFHLLYSSEYIEYVDGKLKPHMFTHGEFYEGGGSGGFYYRKANQRKNRPEQFNYADLIQPSIIRVE